jgi:hypothetical protein
MKMLEKLQRLFGNRNSKSFTLKKFLLFDFRKLRNGEIELSIIKYMNGEYIRDGYFIVKKGDSVSVDWNLKISDKDLIDIIDNVNRL